MKRCGLYTLTDDEVAVLRSLRADKWPPTSCENVAEDVGISRSRARTALLRLVELRLVKSRKGGYGRIRYDLTALGQASSIPS